MSKNLWYYCFAFLVTWKLATTTCGGCSQPYTDEYGNFHMDTSAVACCQTTTETKSKIFYTYEEATNFIINAPDNANEFTLIEIK